MCIAMNTCKSTHTYNPTNLQEYVYTYVRAHINTHHTHIFFPWALPKVLQIFSQNYLLL